MLPFSSLPLPLNQYMHPSPASSQHGQHPFINLPYIRKSCVLPTISEDLLQSFMQQSMFRWCSPIVKSVRVIDLVESSMITVALSGNEPLSFSLNFSLDELWPLALQVKVIFSPVHFWGLFGSSSPLGPPTENKETVTVEDLLPRKTMRKIYDRLLLSRSRRDPLTHFEISILQHIRFAELRKIPIEQPNFTNEYVIWLL